MITEDELFRQGDPDKIWSKYCGFLDLSLTEFMEIQEQLLLKQIDLVSGSPLARRFMPRKPANISEFRKMVSLTTYDDYTDTLGVKNEEVLAVKPYRWGHTSGRRGMVKWVPYTLQSLEVQGRCGIGTLILACAARKGEVKIGSGMRALHNLPPIPYSSGVLAEAMVRQINMRLMPPIGAYEDKSFQERITIGFGMALRDGVDMLSSMTSVLIKMGQSFTNDSNQIKFSRRILNPNIAGRLVTGWVRSKVSGRKLLPKDLWRLKGLIGYGMDTGIYRNELKYYWGKEPLEMYCGTEAGVIASQAWNKKAMTIMPYCSFYEFVEESEWLKSRENNHYQPSTILLDEVKPGHLYEIIVTSFYGGAFLRYRLGDLIRIVALEDKEAGIKLPQMVFESRADDLIDIAGFTRLDEKTIWQAIANSGVKFEDWTIRKEYRQQQSFLHLYIELRGQTEAESFGNVLHENLVAVNPQYRDLEAMLGIRPLKITLLSQGSFSRYYEEKRKTGADLAHLKPAHMNASDQEIQKLLELDKVNS
jgi:hypothetical protein